MPRPLIYGNGRLLLGLDDRLCIRDLFFPQVGGTNHLAGRRIRMGVWVDGQFSWIDGDDWGRELRFEQGLLVGSATLHNDRLKIQLSLTEFAVQAEDAWLRDILVRNLAENAAEVRVFFTQDLCIAESDIGDTAFYHPFSDSVIHYKSHYAFAFSACTAAVGIEQFSTGIKDFGGMEGTWRDAEDGQLSMNPISQGSVDSTFGVSLKLAAGEAGSVRYWLACGRDLDEAAKRSSHIRISNADALRQDAEREQRGWLSHLIQEPQGLSEALTELYRKSLLIIRTQVDRGGAIVAANDSDIMETNRANYSYMWPRDAAMTSSLSDELGEHEIPRRFLQFCSGLISKDRPFFLQKYTVDGAVGASWHPWYLNGHAQVPKQEDETALTVIALWDHFDATQDLDWLAPLGPEFAFPMADFLYEYRDPKTSLPLPSYDLWEERHGVHCFTVASVISGLEAAAKLAGVLSDDQRVGRYQAAAEESRAALRKFLYDDTRGCFYRRLLAGDEHSPDRIVDSATLSVGLLGALPESDSMVLSNLGFVQDRLWVDSLIGGLARYEGDYYFRQDEALPGNPWVICTMWLAQSLLLAAKSQAELEKPMELLQWALKNAAPTGVLPEQLHPWSGEPLSVSPLTWSHAEFVRTCALYSRKYSEFGK